MSEENLFQCFECCQILKNPIGFACHHNLCKECYEKTEYSNTEICPKCKEKDEESQTNNEKFPCGIAGSVLHDIHGEDNYDELCEYCNDGSRIIGKCEECQDNLCDECVSAHKRVTLTKHHTIYLFENNDVQPHESNPTNGSSEKFNEYNLISYCVDCKQKPSQICFQNRHKVHFNCSMADYQEIRRQNEVEIISEGKNMAEEISNIDKIINNIKQMKIKIDSTVKNEFQKIENYFENCKREFDKRAEELLRQIETAKTLKQSVLRKQIKTLNSKKQKLIDYIKTVENSSDSVNIINNTQNRNDVLRGIIDIKDQDDLQVWEDDDFSFIPPDTALFTAIRNLGFISSNTCVSKFGDVN